MCLLPFFLKTSAGPRKLTNKLLSHVATALCLASVTVLLNPYAQASQSAESAQGELFIEGDTAVFLEAENTIEYSGNVIASMDGMRITGDRVLVLMNDDGVKRITTNGEPAGFRQQKEGTNESTTARAKTIVFLPETSLLELSGAAALNQGGNEIRGDSIRYNLALGKLDATGDSTKTERVRMQLSLPDDNVTEKSSNQ